MNKTSSKPVVLFLGKVPPPFIGPAVATEIILNSRLKECFNLIHLDTSDHRPVETLARLDLINFWLALKQYFQLVFYIIKYKPELVYVPAGQTKVGYLRDSVFLIIAKLFRKKLLCHLHGGNFLNFYNGSSNILRWYIRHVHCMVDGQIVLGENLRPLFNWVLPEEKIFVVPNGGNFKIPDFSKNEKIRILYLANYIRSKGIMEVIKAFALLKNHDNVELITAGDWNEPETKNEISEFLKSSSLPIILNGTKTGESKFALYAQSSIFVFPTYYINEGHPFVIIEAMAAGLPVISTNHAAIPESVIEGVNGFLVEKQDPVQIAEKIQYLIDNPEIRESMGKESRRLYEKYFTEEKMINKMVEVFETVLKIN